MLWAELRERIDVIRSHWWTFSLSLLAGGAGAFWIASKLHESRIEALEASNGYLRDQLVGGLPGAPVPSPSQGLPWVQVSVWAVVIVVAVGIISLLGSSILARWRRPQSQEREGRLAPMVPPANRAETKPSDTGKPVQVPNGAEPLRFLKAGPAWREARPHVQVVLATADTHQRPGRGGQIRALIKLSNCTATDLSTCSIYFHSVRTNGRIQRIERYVLKGPERKAHFPIKGNSTASFVLAFRNYNVAPDEPFQINASNPDLSALSTPDHFTLADNGTHHLNLVIESGQGVVTRAVIELEVGEYEELKVGLLGQSSWRPQR
jgi:hypothetical protein